MNAPKEIGADDGDSQARSDQRVYALQTAVALVAMGLVVVAPVLLPNLATSVARAVAVSTLIVVTLGLFLARRPRSTEFALVVGAAALAAGLIALWTGA